MKKATRSPWNERARLRRRRQMARGNLRPTGKAKGAGRRLWRHKRVNKSRRKAWAFHAAHQRGWVLAWKWEAPWKAWWQNMAFGRPGLHPGR